MKNYLSKDFFDSTKQLFRKMRTTSLMLLIFASSLFAANVNSQVAKINISVKDANILNVIESIERQTDYLFVYDKNEIDLDRKVSIELENKSVAELLSKVFSNTDVIYAMEGSNIMLMQKSDALQQQKSISGKVKDSTGEALPGVSVVIKGTTKGVTTDANGNYSITNVPENAVLQFSFVGMKTQDQIVGDLTIIDVILADETIGIEEVVAVGYGTQKKASLTGAVAAVDVKKIDKIPGGDITSMLTGQVAGVNVSSSSGAPGATPQILIRGLGSITSSNPLVVIDGIPGDISFINPSDIESINVLKDASAATIYGSRASNGVIIITTKRGKKGETQVSLKTYLGIHNASTGNVHMANRDGYNQIHTQALTNGGEEIYPWIKDNSLPDTDWADAYLKQGIENKYDFSMLGGSDNATYGFSAGYYKNTGTVINTGYENFSLRLNTDFKLFNDRLKLSPSVSFLRKNLKNMYEATGDGNGGWSDFMETFMQIPHKKIYDSNISNGFAVPPTGFPAGNPIAIRSIETDKSEVDYLQSALRAEFKIIDGLYFKFDFGMNIKENYDYYHMPAYNFGNTAQLENTFLSETRGRENQWVMNDLLTYTKSFGIHKIDALLGFSREKTEYRYIGGSNNRMIADDLTTLGAGIGDKNSWGERNINSLQSYFGRLNYDVSEKYLFQSSVRYDGSSRFSEKNRYGLFYSFSGGWALHKESFFNVAWISELKPRVSYGTLGNQNIGDFQYLDLITTGGPTLNYPLGSPNIVQPISIGATTINSAAYNIKWEESATLNSGFDMGLFNNRVTLNFDYFKTNTKDMLVVIPRPYTSGFNNFPRTNGGSMENKGWESTISYHDSKGGFRYDIALNLSHSKNILTKLGSYGESYIDGYVDYYNNPTTKTEVGGEVGRFYMYRASGIFKNTEEVKAHKVQPDAVPGDLIFEDANKDGTLDDNDKVYVGSAMPDIEYGINLNLGYKSFDLSLFIEGKQGNEMYNGMRMMQFRTGVTGNTLAELTNAWTPQNTNSDIYRNSSTDENYNMRVSSYFLENASYMRLKNIQLSYNVKPAFIQRYKIHGVKLYVGSLNPLTITKYKGFDPALVNSGIFSRGVDRGYYPLTSSFYFGLNFDF